jgi:nitrate reductase gamma subunit
MTTLFHWGVWLFVAFIFFLGFVDPETSDERTLRIDEERRAHDAADAAYYAQNNRHDHHR